MAKYNIRSSEQFFKNNVLLVRSTIVSFCILISLIFACSKPVGIFLLAFFILYILIYFDIDDIGWLLPMKKVRNNNLELVIDKVTFYEKDNIAEYSFIDVDGYIEHKYSNPNNLPLNGTMSFSVIMLENRFTKIILIVESN